jgi:hypothetical protein
MLAWHFLRDDRRLSYHPHTLVEVGKKLTVKPPLELCRWGLHASKRALEALQYAPGPIACRVELSGEILEGDDKVCATERTVLQMVDATNVLHEFACWCAEQALLREREAGREPDPRSWAAIDAKRKWLRGEITDSELADAWDAAKDVAWEATRAAAGAAVGAVAWEATWDADREAAWDIARATAGAARAAAWDAAREAAWDIAWAVARDVAWDATREAAWDAAWDAARDAQNTRLEKMLLEAMEETA